MKLTSFLFLLILPSSLLAGEESAPCGHYEQAVAFVRRLFERDIESAKKGAGGCGLVWVLEVPESTASMTVLGWARETHCPLDRVERTMSGQIRIKGTERPRISVFSATVSESEDEELARFRRRLCEQQQSTAPRLSREEWPGIRFWPGDAGGVGARFLEILPAVEMATGHAMRLDWVRESDDCRTSGDWVAGFVPAPTLKTGTEAWSCTARIEPRRGMLTALYCDP